MIETEEPYSAPSGFRPPRLLRNPHVQSVVASFKPRERLVHRRVRQFIAASTACILDCGDGVRLQGLHASHRNDSAPLAVLIHGWEGCADSLYIVSAGDALYRLGYDVFRLNLRDHGGTQHLNRGLFHSCRIDEVVGAIAELQRLFPRQPLLLGGYSLGGNFAIRVAVRTPAAGIDIKSVVAVCPVLEPERTLIAMEQGWFAYQHYFMRRWRRSLRVKHACFPQHYDLETILAQPGLRELTSYFVDNHTEFRELREYLQGYSITGERLAKLAVPTHVLAALDDPIIPAGDLSRLARSSNLHIHVSPRGGHCGFLEDYGLRSWSDGEMSRYFEEAML